MITIIDYKIGNLGSIRNMIKYLGYDCIITNNAENILNSKKIILPGVGNFDYGMKKLKELGLIEILNQKVLSEKTPLLGICLGMQLLTSGSEEGTQKGLSWIKGYAKRFPAKDDLRIPNMGWNYISQVKESELFKITDEETRFYFVHSYYVECEQTEDILFTAEYGIKYACGIEKENIYGVQFHPEKSHKFGKKLLKNFIEL